ncbi:MAG: HlyD family efflux transporter periplasmic adaptor subunit [Dysgonamonadaceae bacterium]|jgi:HlyD family secretion protein|nr:HlyD family efflux transporter periplasmic adaptor subunit [Dysgonamonadaceae bacterium]
MDRKIPKEVIVKRKRKIIIQIAALLILVIIVFIVCVKMFRSGISRDDIFTSIVDRGAIEISVSATGKVTPLSEEIIITPVSTKILEVYKKAGDSIVIGDAIIRLDLASVHSDVENQNDELAMKQYRLEQQKVASQSSLSDLEMQIEIDEMRIRRMEVLLRNEIFLDSIGAGTSDKIKQAELELTVERLKLKQLKVRYENQKQSAVADTRVLELDYNIALKNANLKNKMMQEAQIRSPRTGILTWINDQIGAKTPEGTQLAIVSDLNHFKVEAEISDSYGNKVLTGNRVIVKSFGTELRGTVGNVIPSVKNGIITFTVLLEDNTNKILRSGLKVDVYVVNSVRNEILRIANRSYYTGEGEYELWTVKDNQALKRHVRLGESSYNYVEVIEGLKEGETVIVSDMNRYKDYNKLNIR